MPPLSVVPYTNRHFTHQMGVYETSHDPAHHLTRCWCSHQTLITGQVQDSSHCQTVMFSFRKSSVRSRCAAPCGVMRPWFDFRFRRYIHREKELLLYKSLFTEENGSTQKHSSESINTNKAKTAKTATKSITVVDTWNYIIIILHQTWLFLRPTSYYKIGKSHSLWKCIVPCLFKDHSSKSFNTQCNLTKFSTDTLIVSEYYHRCYIFNMLNLQ